MSQQGVFRLRQGTDLDPLLPWISELPIAYKPHTDLVLGMKRGAEIYWCLDYERMNQAAQTAIYSYYVRSLQKYEDEQGIIASEPRNPLIIPTCLAGHTFAISADCVDEVIELQQTPELSTAEEICQEMRLRFGGEL